MFLIEINAQVILFLQNKHATIKIMLVIYTWKSVPGKNLRLQNQKFVLSKAEKHFKKLSK